jgi:hypothetical protein
VAGWTACARSCWRAASPRLAVLLAAAPLAFAVASCGGGEEPARSRAAAGTGPSPQFGIAAGGVIEFASDADVARELDGYVDLGVGWIRADLKWEVVEGEPGRHDWRPYDRLARAALRRGLRVLFVVGYPPDWAMPDGGASSIDPAAYARFAVAGVRRFAPLGVRHYELWNEPNSSAFWEPRPDPAAYAALVRTAYPAMKDIDASVVVVAGALAPVGGTEPPECAGGAPKIGPVPFLEGMYRQGAGGSFDAVSYHPYTGAALPGDEGPCHAWFQLDRTAPSLRSVMEANGDGAKEIWATEFGAIVDEVGEERQAELVRAAVARWPRYPWAGPLFVYAYHDSSTDHRYDLVRPDWTPRPAWHAYRDAVAAARGARD